MMAGRILQSGSHIARTATVEMPDGTWEAQVFVRLAREPEIAETYIPAGIYQSEQEAQQAAEQRATRAIEQQEF